MAEIVISVASKVAEYLVAPVGRQCGYVVFTDSYVRQLKDELEKLDNARQRVQHSVDDALNDMKLIEADVQTWAKDAETVSNEAHDVLENDGRAKKTCFRGWLPNPKGRYCLGRDARKTAQAIQELIPQGKFKRVYYERARPALVGGAAEVNSSACDGGDTIQELIPLGQFENPLPGLVGGAPDMNLLAGGGGDTITDSRASIFQDIMKALHDEKLKVVGVYGPGGVGKTTLLKKVEEKLRKEGRPFQMIVKAEVLQTPDLNNIQGQIADALKLDLKDKQSQQGRRDHLLQRLQQDPSEKILIILDDLWDKLDLNAVGIPFGDESRGCKLLLTSRFSDVLQQKMLADQTFRLEGLNDGEAFQLFEKTVGDKLKDEELRRIAPKIVKKLAGLPLLIISVASTLKYSHVSAWNKALRKIDESDIKTIVKLSYDHLNSEDAKSLFLLCGLIGGTIRVETLFVLGMGLGLFEECNETMQDSRDELNIALDRLRSICLLQDGGDDKENVTIHDLYSEVVVSTPFRDRNSLMMNNNYGFWLKEKLEKCWAICLADVGKDRLTELMKCQFPNLKILMLSQDWHWMREHQHDVEECWRLQDFIYMKELRVLYLRSMHISSFSSSIGILGSLHSLYLDDCDVEDVKILGKLKALQILSFAKSAISRLPKEIGELTNLRSLNLSNCNRLETIEPGVLEGLIKLEELYMKSSFDQWMGTDEIPSESCNARLAELKSLTRLTTLEISIPNPTILFKDGDLPFGNLIKFWFNIGNVNGRVFQVRTMKLKLEGCDSFLLKDWVQETLQKTQYLHLDGLREFKKNAHELCVRGFTQLKHLDIQNSPSIKYIASSSSDLPIAFTMLESLFLENLINLEKLCNGLVAPDCFSKLKVMRIIKCCKLENLWFQSKMQRLVHLEEIQICECDSLQAIITYDARKVEATANDIVELPDVRHLELRKLSKMTSFCTGAKGAPIQVSLPRLESLVIDGLLGLEKILYSEPSFKYNNLKSLKIEESKLTSIIPKDWLLKLPNLESMAIAGTPFVEVVFDLEELKVLEEVKILSQLSTLALSKLPNLRCMWKQDVQLQGISILQNLKKLSIKNTGLSFLFPFSVAKCLREIRQIEVKNCPNMKAVIVDEEGRDDGTDGILEFPSLKRLSISCCPTKKFFSYPPGEKESIVTTSDSKDTYFDSFFDQKISLPSLKKLKMNSVGSLTRIWHGELPKSSFDKLAKFTCKKCSNLLDVFPSTIMGRLHNLIKVKVSKCPSLESLFDFGSLDSCMEQTIELLRELKEVDVVSCPSLESLFNWGPLDSSTKHKIVLLPKLEEVGVSGAGRLRHVVMSDSQTILGFPSLKLVHVHNCSELRYLFPNYTATTLEKLDVLKIFKCKQMKEVVPKGEGGRSKAEGMSFPSLTNLAIWRCPNFRAFIWSPTSAVGQPGEMIEENDELPRPLFNDMVRFPNLEKLYIGGVQCKELWSNQISDDSFCKLESLILNDCDNLQHIAPSHMWKRLQDCLETLEVKSCCSIEIIYESDGKVAKSGNLRTLNLRDLDNLRHIWWYDSLPIIPFPNLRYVKAVRCSRLDMLFTTFTAKFLRQIEKLVVGSCEDMVLIAGHEECEEVTGKTITFSGLTTLRLYNLPKFESFLPEKYFAKFPSLDVSSRTEPDQGNRSVEESEGEIEELDSEIEFDSKIDEESEGEIEFDSEIDEESEGEIEELDSEIDGESEGEIEEFDNEIDEESEWEIEEFDSEIDKESEGE
ncbi:hypothetical protein ACJRO7_026631 [Eucalyptus globulus]|uniref:AAA+ ATPase domain-containing protein n=1 Tax=Eucalyptus globulus TaxID=34317 RepID=A0ABD3JPL8_EUCGL